MAFEYAVVLTGSIATGKSTVAKIFKAFGFTIIDADSIAHQLLDKHAQEVAQLFGKGILETKGINRKALGAIVFQDTQKRTELEALLHPLIYDEIARLSILEDKKKKPYLIDIPLFFETNRYPVEKTIVVYTPKVLQIQRLMQRNGYSKEEAQLRIEMQIDIEEKKQKATYLIDNSQDMEHLQEECDKMREQIVGDFQ
jgi:dephospho-CoA kinase